MPCQPTPAAAASGFSITGAVSTKTFASAANVSQIQASLKSGDHDYHLHVVEAHNTGPSTTLTMSAFIALCSALVGKALESQLVVLGTMSLGGNIVPVENLAE